MSIENLDIELLPFLGAMVIVILLGLGVGPVIRCLTDSIKPQKAPSSALPAGKPIGLLESVLFTISIIVGYPIFIGGWLAFKVAAKWETWAHLVKIPELNDFEFTSDSVTERLRFASWVHTRFMIGALLNILISAIGAWSYLQFTVLASQA